MLATACRPVDRGADVASDVDRGKSDAASGIVNEHGLPGFREPMTTKQLRRSEVASRYRRGLLVGERGRFPKMASCSP